MYDMKIVRRIGHLIPQYSKVFPNSTDYTCTETTLLALMRTESKLKLIKTVLLKYYISILEIQVIIQVRS